jgi:hypothetical protein
LRASGFGGFDPCDGKNRKDEASAVSYTALRARQGLKPSCFEAFSARVNSLVKKTILGPFSCESIPQGLKPSRVLLRLRPG